MTTILVVNSDATARRTTQYVLQAANYTVITARDTYQASLHLMRLQCDLLITDLSAPQFDGVAFLRTLRSIEYYHNLPVIVLSNSGHRHDRQLALELRVSVCLSKPVRSDVLVATVRRALQQRFTSFQSIGDFALMAVPQSLESMPAEIMM